MYISDKRAKIIGNWVVFFLFLGLFFSFSTQAVAGKQVYITVEGRQIDFDVKPYIDSQNRTIVPLRFIGQELGYSVGWKQETREVIIMGENDHIKLWIGKREALVNGKKVSLDTNAAVTSGRAMVPLRFILENLGAYIEFNEMTKVVNITKKPVGENNGKPAEDVSLIKVNSSVVNLRNGPGKDYAIVGEAKQGERYLVTDTTGGWYRLALAGGKSAWVMQSAVDPIDVSNISDRNVVNPLPKPQPNKPEPTASLKGKIIVIDPGHAKIQPEGWPDPGAVGPTGLQEKDVVLDIGNKVVKKLESKGAQVFITRTGNTTLTLAGRADIANTNKADVFVSIHMNANANRAYNGTAVYYYNGEQGEANKKLASVVQKHLVQSLGLKDIGIIGENFVVLNYTKVPAILVETAFISNAEEEKLAYMDSFREKAAQGIVNGIESYLAN